MGQRLVISINRGEKRIATVYYHWAGYTTSAMECLRDLVGIYNHNFEALDGLKDDEFVAGIVARLPGGGGFSKEASDYMKRNFVISEPLLATNRNDGIVDVTDEGMADSDGYAEAAASIDFTRKIFSVEDVVFWYDQDEFRNEILSSVYEKDSEEIRLFDPDKLPVLRTLSEIPFVEMDDFAKKLRKISEGRKIKGVNEGDEEDKEDEEINEDLVITGAFCVYDDGEGIYTMIE